MKTMGGFTPLMIAATNNEDDVVTFLCEYPGTPSLDLDVKVMQSIRTIHGNSIIALLCTAKEMYLEKTTINAQKYILICFIVSL